MPYVMKAADGKIEAARPDSTSQNLIQMQGWEFVEANDKPYIDFLETSISEHDPFRESDIQLARVLEDLIGLLIDREVIRFTDFPAAAQKRLIFRQSLRNNRQSLNILDENIGLLI